MNYGIMSDMSSESNGNYSSDSIKVCKGLEGVKIRPGMYIGDTDDGTGLHHMIFELSDNAFDEVSECDFCDSVICEIHSDGSVSVTDNGRGIPVDIHKEEGVSAAEVIMTNLHAGGKFDQNTYKMSGGLHGLGVSVVNALSSWLELTIYRDNKKHFMRFEEGIPCEALKVIQEGVRKRGTCVRFMPSSEIFSFIEFDFKVLEQRFRELSFLNPNVKIRLIDKRPGQEKIVDFFSESGMEDFVKHLDKNKSSLIPVPISFSGSLDSSEMILSLSMQWNESYYENTLCFTNNIKQKDGGSHLSGFRSALTRALNNYISSENILKKQKLSLTSDDMREGLTCVLSLKMSEPKFSSQTKDKLVSSSARTVVESIVFDNFSIWLEENPKTARVIIDKMLEAAYSREAAKKARELTRKKGALELASLSGKLTPCREKSPESSEVLLLEGQSAAGTAKQGRDSRYQAVLPLKGKILNVERVRFDKVLSSNEISCLISALGAGVGEGDFDIEKLRYHKIIIMTDADVDGAHIRALLLTFFFRYMRQVIERGHLYIAQPPLYRIVRRGKERFLKDELALKEYLWNSVLSESSLTLNDGSVLSGEDLGLFLDKCRSACLSFKKYCADVPSFMLESYCYASNLKSALDIYGEAKYDVKEEGDIVSIYSEVAGVVKQYKINALIKSELNQAIELLGDSFNSALGLQIKNSECKVVCPSHLLETMNRESSKGITMQRFKGLGEMNAKQLWDTTLNPDNRTLIKLSIEDAEAVDEMFSVLMGSIVAPRKQFIMENALNALNIDA